MLINSLIINLLKNFFKFHKIVEEKEKEAHLYLSLKIK